MKRMYVALVWCVVLGVMSQAATITTQLETPTVQSSYITQLVPCTTDTDNINGTAGYSGDNDASTYVAGDRTTQGQTFTMTSGGVLNNIWVKHVGWTTYLNNGTWASFGDGSQITVRVCSVSGTTLTVLRSEVATVAAGSGFTSSGNNGTGRWIKIALATPVVLGAGTYAFDMTSYSPWFELDGQKAGPYAGGDAYTASPKEALTMTVHTGQDRTFILDMTTDIGNDSPANGATNIPVARTSPGNDLVFTIYKAGITKADVLFGLENDPNLSLKPQYKIVSDMPVTQGQYTVNLESLAADLANLTTYYWKVVGYEPNGPGFTAVPGPVSSFTTAPANAVISAVSPAYTSVDTGSDVVLSVTGVSVESYQWYKYDSEDEYALWEGTKYEGVTTPTLKIKNFQLADEGYYYCIGSNSLPSSASNRDTGPGHILTKRLIIHYPLDTVNGNTTPDVVGGYDMTLSSSDGGTDLPTLVTGVTQLGGNALLFNNSNPADPNFWGQYATAGDVDMETMGNGLTIAFWVQWVDDNTNWQGIINRRGTWAADNMMWRIDKNPSTGEISFERAGGSGRVATSLVKGTWHQITATYDYASGVTRMYNNGELVASGSGFTFGTGTNAGFKLGCNNDDGTEQFYGKIDDVKIYNYARTPIEIGQEYANLMNVWVCNNALTALAFDFNDDCKIDLQDFAIFAADWLESNRINPQ